MLASRVITCLICTFIPTGLSIHSQQVESDIMNRTVGMFLDGSVPSDIKDRMGVILEKLFECCDTQVVFSTDEKKAEISEVLELLQVSNGGIVTMTECEMTLFVGEAAATLGVQHIALPPPHCPTDLQQRYQSTTYYMTPQSWELYKALVQLLFYVEGPSVQIVYDDISVEHHSFQWLVRELSKHHIYVVFHRLQSDITVDEIKASVIRKIQMDAKDGIFVNVVTLLAPVHMRRLLQAVLENLTLFTHTWMVCGEPVYFSDIDLDPWTKSNFVIVSTRLLDVKGTSWLFHNRTSQGLVGLTLAAIFAAELSSPGSMVTFRDPPTRNCRLLSVPIFYNLKEQAVWMAMHKEHLFRQNGFRKDVVIEVWNLMDALETSVKPHRRASWTQNSGLVVKERSLFPFTSSDFGNQLLKVAASEAQPFIIRREHQNGTVSFTGLCIDMLREIAKQLNFRYELVEPPDRVYGSALSEDKQEWNGMIAMVMKREVALAIGPFTVSEDRSRVVDFTTPFMEDRAGIAVHREANTHKAAYEILRPFSYTVWLAIAVAILVVGVLLFCMDNIGAYVSTEDGYPRPLRFLSYIWKIFGDYVEQNAAYQPRPFAAQGLLVFWWFFAIIMSSTYTANLAALYTVVIQPKHIDSLEDLANSPNVQPLLSPGSYINDLFRTSEEGVLLNTVAQRLPAMADMPRKAADALKKVSSSENYAYISDSSQLEYWVSQDSCSLVMAKERFNSLASFAFAVPKNSPYLPSLNTILVRLQESGLMDRWYPLWWKATESCVANKGPIPASIEFSGIVGSLYILVVGIGLGLSSVTVEIIVDRLVTKCFKSGVLQIMKK